MITRTWRLNKDGLVIVGLRVLGVLVYQRALFPWEQPPLGDWGWRPPVSEEQRNG